MTANPSRCERVFVADDDPEMRSLIAHGLAREGYAVTVARDGAELLGLLMSTVEVPAAQPDVIVVDLRMPRLSGLGVIRALKRGGWKIPTILITADASDDVLRRVARHRLATIMHKPFDMDDLSTAVLNAAKIRLGAGGTTLARASLPSIPDGA